MQRTPLASRACWAASMAASTALIFSWWAASAASRAALASAALASACSAAVRFPLACAPQKETPSAAPQVRMLCRLGT